ncbi:sensor histidine kinase [Streptococcus ovuberis]|uniref:Sensor histidine kinase n=1 Tax=Streptococcus ovuberis TaxID=1936207 RepID=A0A7X6MZU4_9STRE|nr:GHKL domain-containing protein [Streptococcus ovuberis]NKZ19627.1 sensor histidine kinase [Streptococcus ovuberis]
MYFDFGTVSQYSKYLIFAYLFMIVSVLILLNNKIVAYQEEIFQREKEEQYRRLQLYTNEIQTLYQTVRGFKHDYKNMLITLRDSIQTGDIENVRYLYQNILVSADISLSEGENIDDLSRLESPALKSLLYHKFNQARQEGVTIHLEIKDEVTGLQMELLDFVRVLSILVDNAIEAAKETLKPEVFFAIIRQGTRYIIHIKNSIKSSLIPVSQIFKQGYSSKGKGRGEGLFTVSQIIKRYCKVAIETEVTDLFFTQIVYIGD